MAEQIQRPIVVTGASGFVGANLLRRCAARGQAVIGIEGPTGSDWRTRGLNVEIVRLDLCNEADVKAFIRQVQPRAVLNCAAYGAYPSQTDASRIYRVNFDAVRFMLEALRGSPGFAAFVQAGSSSEYGLNCTAPSETDPTQPDSDYAVSKLATSALLSFYATKHGLPCWGLRLYSVYGPFEDLSRLIPRLLLAAKQNDLPPLVNPAISRDFVYVDDVAEAFERIVERAEQLRRGQIYNIGAGRRVTLDDLVAVARATFGISKAPAWGSMPDRHWDHRDWYSNPDKARRELDWSAGTSLADGLRKTMDWICAHPDLVREGEQQSVTAVKA
ncbi:MAG TPA: NAD-dependent epimerase/dehydratase family protein [Polyangiaceae bacterium]|nr:NAD-dependent epimerase/dehydratase family protein [Polyangiaceae bacterium]